jgi:short-subunit dehydrogenase
MPHSLAEQVVLITGASSGIGAALATVLAQRYLGIRLVLAARSTEKLKEVAIRCRKAGAEVLVVQTDMTQTDQITNLATAALTEFGRVDALVSNAGYGQMGPIELISAESTQRQFQVNVLGPLTLIRALIPAMRNQGGGRIITISSLGGRVAFPLGGLYSASKFALEGLSDALRMELAPFNIHVSVVEPGPVRTDFFVAASQQIEAAIAKPQDTPYRAAFKKLEQLEQQVDRRAWTSEQVAGVIIRALVDRHPQPRYLAATGGGIMLFLMTKLLPTRLVDLFWQRFYGIHLVARDWDNHQNRSSQVTDPLEDRGIA